MHPDMQQKYLDQLKLFSNIFVASYQGGKVEEDSGFDKEVRAICQQTQGTVGAH